MEPKRKKYERFVRNNYYKFNYYLYILLRLFRKPKKIDKSKIKKILVIEQTVIGDLLVITPVLTTIKKMFPKAKVDLIMYEKFSQVMECNPNLNTIIGIDKEPSIFGLKKIKEFCKLKKVIKKEKYDLSVTLHHGTFANSLLTLFSGIKTRIGCTKAGLLKGKGFFLTHKLKVYLKSQHVVKQNMDVLSLIEDPYKINKDPKLEIHFRKQDEKWVEEFFKKNKITTMPKSKTNKLITKNQPKKTNKQTAKSQKPLTIALHPGTRHGSHEWYNDRFAEIADWLIEKYNAKIIFTGDPYDYEYFVKKIIKLMKHKKEAVYAKTSLLQCAALLSRCDLLFSVDTSMVHIGAAAGTAVIGLYGSGKPESWKPWGKNCNAIFNEHVECTSCRRTYCTRNDYICMNSISVKQAKDEIEKMLGKIKKNKII